MSLTLLYWIIVAVMFAGAIGEFIPGMPGASLILVALLTWAVATGFAGIGWPIILVFAVLIVSAAVEWIGVYWGAKKFGASKWGQIGAFVGLVVGFLGLLPVLPVGGPILGILVGPMVGAFLGEFLSRNRLALAARVKTALKASFGIVVGTILGNVLDGVLAIAAVILFVVTTPAPLGGI